MEASWELMRTDRILSSSLWGGTLTQHSALPGIPLPTISSLGLKLP